MEMFKSYLLQNWILILILLAFLIILVTTAFLDKKATRRMIILIASIFVLSITVFIEFYYQEDSNYRLLRTILMSIRYSATPLILSLIIYTLTKKMRAFVFIPAGCLLIINILSIFNGIVFKIDENNDLIRGPLGYLPFILVGLYCAFLIYILIKQSNKRVLEVIPIIFLAVSFCTGLIFPFIFGPAYSQIFCPTIAVALFIYYVFSVLQLSKKDALTGLLNRQAYYIETTKLFKDITAVVSLDMNGLKKINDTYGHHSGDEALTTIAFCIARSCKVRQSAYRLGGDEFVVVCFKTSKEEVEKLVQRIVKSISETSYTCSIGYSYQNGDFVSLDELLKASDEQMYLDKANYYKKDN